MTFSRMLTAWLLAGSLAAASVAPTSSAAAAQAMQNYSAAEIVTSGHQIFGRMSGNIATMVEQIVARHGLPNGYVIGEEASGAVVGGLRYGEGMLYTKSDGARRVFWQGPSVGLDLGGDGNRTMMLVYDLPHLEAIYRRFAGVNGAAYLIGGFGMTVLAHKEAGRQPVVLVPIRTGVGARLGVNMGYLKFTAEPTWNPF